MVCAYGAKLVNPKIKQSDKEIILQKACVDVEDQEEQVEKVVAPA